jgi:hypothetical protein
MRFSKVLLSFYLAGFLWCRLGARADEGTHETFEAGSVKFTRPKGWEWVEPTSSMRKAQLRIPDPGSKQAGEVVFFYFGPGGAGGVQANVNRWFGQFKGSREEIHAKTEEVEISGIKVVYVRAEGTYMSGMPGGVQTAMPDSGLIGAVIDIPGGSVFVKFTGPKGLVESHQAEFRKMVEGALKK